MTKKTVGYVHLIWTCPRCMTKNPGPQKFCNGCGGPQPKDVSFEQPAEERLITDQAEIARAKAGPDIHCPYCGARNAAEAKFCGGCGGDLKGGEARKSGQVLGAHRAGPAQPITCRACGSSNPADAQRCRNCGADLATQPAGAPSPVQAPSQRPVTSRSLPIPLLVGAGVIGLLVILCLVIFASRTENVQAQVAGVEWTRSVPIEALVPVEAEAWHDEVPSNAEDVTCRLEYRYTQDQPAPNAKEVCGTEYTEDTGSGYGEVVKDCVYEVYEDLCAFTVLDWQVVDTVTLTGSDLNPLWPQFPLEAGQREGQPEEAFEVTFQDQDRTYTYTVSDPAEFAMFRPGSTWALRLNALSGVVGVEPVK